MEINLRIKILEALCSGNVFVVKGKTIKSFIVFLGVFNSLSLDYKIRPSFNQ